jgi:hypothetical protein
MARPEYVPLRISAVLGVVADIPPADVVLVPLPLFFQGLMIQGIHRPVHLYALETPAALSVEET